MRRFLLAVSLLLLPLPAHADVTVAVASNFQTTLEALKPGFEAATGEKLVIVAGATGKLATQIAQGAPYDVFLSADDKATKKVSAAGPEFTYALGVLALYGAVGPEALKGSFGHLAIANPQLAPYGAAAVEALARLGLAQALGRKIVMGENIAQAFAMVDSGNAELAFVALSQAKAKGGKFWVVPEGLHAPIRQNAVPLKDSGGARAFVDYLKSDAARAVIAQAGYGLP